MASACGWMAPSAWRHVDATRVSVVACSPLVYSLAPLIHSRIVAYSGESLVNRMPPPCDSVADPATPSVSELDVGLRRIKLFSGFAWSTTFNAVENVALNSVCVEWQCTQAYPSRPRLVRIGST